MSSYRFFFFKQKTAYEMRISDWSSDVCSSDLRGLHAGAPPYGVITADVQGDKLGGTWRRLTGSIIERICTQAGVAPDRIDSASLAALDTAAAALPGGGHISLYLTEQTKVLDLVQRLALDRKRTRLNSSH